MGSKSKEGESCDIWENGIGILKAHSEMEHLLVFTSNATRAMLRV